MMAHKESLSEFYKRIDCSKSFHLNGKPHVNVFERKYCSTRIPFSRRDYYKVTLILGEGTLSYADRIIQIDRPALLFSTPHDPYAWSATSEKQEGWFCLFNESFLKDRDSFLHELPMFQAGKEHVFFPKAPLVNKIANLFQQMMDENRHCYEHKPDVLRAYLHLIAHQGLKMQPHNHSSKNSNAAARITHRFLELLERQFPVYGEQNTVSLKSAKDFANELSIHINYLNRSVKQVTGKTTTEHIANRIALEAQAMLRYSNWNISEIAYTLGFEYPAHFTHFFKKKTGQSPATLRKEIV